MCHHHRPGLHGTLIDDGVIMSMKEEACVNSHFAFPWSMQHASACYSIAAQLSKCATLGQMHGAHGLMRIVIESERRPSCSELELCHSDAFSLTDIAIPPQALHLQSCSIYLHQLTIVLPEDSFLAKMSTSCLLFIMEACFWFRTHHKVHTTRHACFS